MIRRVALMALAGLLVVAGIWYVGFWSPEDSQLTTARAHEVQAEANVSALSAQLAAIRAQSRQLPSEKATLALLNEAVPKGPSLDGLLETVTAAAATAHVGLTSIGTPEPAGWGTSAAGAAATSAGPPTITMSIGINVTSSLQILDFVTALEAQPRLYVVDSFDLQGLPATGSLASGTGSGKSLTGHGAGGSKSSKSASVEGTSVTVQAFYVSASSNDPAGLNVSFAAPGGSKKSTAKGAYSATSRRR